MSGERVALIILGVVFGIAFFIAAIGEVNAVNDAREAAGRASDAGIDVYMRAIGHSAALAVVAAVFFLGAAIVRRLDV